MRKIVLLGLVVATMAANAHGACQGKTIIACTTTNGKQVEVCDNNDTIGYSFGKPNSPEKSLKLNRSDVSIQPMSGGYGCGNVDFSTGDTTYSVFSCSDKVENTSYGVDVYVKKKHAATIKCSTKNKIVDNIADYPSKD